MNTRVFSLACLLLLASCAPSLPFVIDERVEGRRTPRNFDGRRAGELPPISGSIRLPSPDPTLYSDDSRMWDVQGRVSGLPLEIGKVYVMLFADFAGNYVFQYEFDRELKLDLENLGYDTGIPMSGAQAVVNGKIDTLVVSDPRRVTNIEGLLYSLTLEFDASKPDGEPLMRLIGIEERLIVADTNAYTTNEVIPLLAGRAAKHVSEAIRYGWQQSSEWTNGNIPVLGYENGSDSSTNGR